MFGRKGPSKSQHGGHYGFLLNKLPKRKFAPCVRSFVRGLLSAAFWCLPLFLILNIINAKQNNVGAQLSSLLYFDDTDATKRRTEHRPASIVFI